jgi:hypothetical protein
MKMPVILSFDIPYVLDFFFSSRDVTSARPGHLIDVMATNGGVMLWCGHRHLVLEIHALRALPRLWARLVAMCASRGEAA